MKRILPIVMAALMCAVLGSCGRQNDADAVMACYNAAKQLIADGEYDAARQMIDEAVAKYGDGALLDSLVRQMDPSSEPQTEAAEPEAVTEMIMPRPEPDSDLELEPDTTEEYIDTSPERDDALLQEYRIWTNDSTEADTTQPQDTTTTTRIYTTAKPNVVKTTARVTTTRAPQTQPATTTVPVTTTKSAREKALDLAREAKDQTTLSRSQMIDRLKENGSSDEDAVYAADHCGADWNIQAFKAAKQIAAADTSGSLSREMVRAALQHAGFAESEVSYAVDRVDLSQNA